jgi:hypothetical protein
LGHSSIKEKGKHLSLLLYTMWRGERAVYFAQSVCPFVISFHLLKVMISKSLFYEILERIGRLKPVPIGYD